MTAHEVEQMVLRLLAEYSYQQPEPGSTVGSPWSAEKVGGYVELLKQSLVSPRLERFALAETYEQIRASSTECADFWVVAERGEYLEWYDPATNEFGLGQLAADAKRLVSIGVRGDLVGVFCAM
ncbi:hypothetical protein NP603_21765 [Methylomonas sp. SURF-1]|uniref:Uncharacterized protein n=1 Tax=Methylomonas aurea TaxID=2952224 RepID=A0ABT1UND7_9GAMM|nr:hypothetical protein [Methylomonas sp. SURF-1]MCQ8183745.1 hypothetical protein [Methylomonas sp. SURF-1]